MKVAFLFLSLFIAGVYNCDTDYKWASPAIQLVANESTFYSDGIFFGRSGNFFYVDTIGSSCYVVNTTTGNTEHIYLEEFENMKIAFKYPLKSDRRKGVIAADNKIFPYKFDTNKNDLIFDEPVTVTSDTGYQIQKGHADSQGRLTIIMNCKSDKKHNGGRLYTFDNKAPVLTKQFDTDILDFVLSHDEKYMYVIADFGRAIYEYNYNIGNGEISNERKVGEMPKYYPKGQRMTGIEINSEGYLYITTNYGYILKINSEDGGFSRKIRSTITSMTGITFGHSGLFITTTKMCHYDDNTAGGVIHVHWFNATGIPDYPVKW